MNNTNDLTATQTSPVNNFVITLGKRLLQEKVKDWLDMEGVARFCKVHAIHLDDKVPGSAELESKLRKFFEPSGQFYTEDLNLDCYDRPQGWNRPLMIRAYPYHPAQRLGLAGFVNAEEQVGGVETADVAVGH